jgi:lactoylglutathione lyase
VEESIDFFCNKLGLVEIKRTENEQGRFTLFFLAAPEDLKSIELSKGPMLELTYNWDPQPYSEGRNFGHLAYGVDNIYDTCQRLQEAGVVINRPPRDGYMAFIRSPDNISIELLQNGKPLTKQEPWLSNSKSKSQVVKIRHGSNISFLVYNFI